MKSLRARLLLLLSVAVTLAALVQAVAVFRNAMNEADAVFDYHLQQLALSLATGDMGLPGFGPDVSAGNNVDYVVQVWAPDGKRIYVSRPRSDLPSQAVLGYTNVQVGNEQWRVYSMQAGGRTIQVAQPLLSRRTLALTFAFNSVWPMLLIAPLLLLVVAWVVRRSLKPLRTLSQELESRAATSFDPIDPQPVMQEMQPVVRAMNGLFTRTRQAFDTQQMFVADAAHELRSPLAALKLQLQGLQRAPDTATRERAVERLGSGIDRATRLVEQLLALARQEAQIAAGAPPQPVPLAELARQAVLDATPAAQQRGIDLGLAPVPPEAEGASVPGHAQALAILLRNLLDNAIKYTPRGGRVDVALQADDGHITLLVDDSGPGIAPAERAQVLQRFHRGAQPEGAPASGSGLGLAIADSIARLHGARLQLADAPQLGGLRVSLRLARHTPPRESPHT